MQDVVDRSKLSLRSFYQTFASKDDLLLALFEECVAGAAEWQRGRMAKHDDPIEQIRVFLTSLWSGQAEPGGRARALACTTSRCRPRGPATSPTRSEPQLDVLLEAVERGIATGPGADDIDARRLAEILLHTGNAAVHTTILQTGSESPDDVWAFCLGRRIRSRRLGRAARVRVMELWELARARASATGSHGGTATAMPGAWPTWSWCSRPTWSSKPPNPTCCTAVTRCSAFLTGVKQDKPDSAQPAPPPVRTGRYLPPGKRPSIRHFTSNPTDRLRVRDRARGCAPTTQVLSSFGLDHWGRYLDEFGVVDGEWLITKRTVTTEGVDPDGWAAVLA